VRDSPTVLTLLFRETFGIGLSGSYNGVKQVLNEISDQYSGRLLLQSLSITRLAASAAIIDANMELVLLRTPDGDTLSQ
jgi:hypothetical protein